MWISNSALEDNFETPRVSTVCHASVRGGVIVLPHNKVVSGKLKDAGGKAQKLMRTTAFLFSYS